MSGRHNILHLHIYPIIVLIIDHHFVTVTSNCLGYSLTGIFDIILVVVVIKRIIITVKDIYMWYIAYQKFQWRQKFHLLAMNIGLHY